MTVSVLRSSAVAVFAAAVIAGCGSSSSSSITASSASTTTSSSSSSSSTSTSAGKVQGVALSASDLPSTLGTLSQVSDGLLGTTPNTDARVFATADNNTRVEVDLAGDTSASAASTDYAAYNGAAGKQVTTQSATSTPSIGSQANEYAGTDSKTHNIVSVAFVQGSVICVVTAVSTGTIDNTAVEAVAKAQEQKITAANL